VARPTLPCMAQALARVLPTRQLPPTLLAAAEKPANPTAVLFPFLRSSPCPACALAVAAAVTAALLPLLLGLQHPPVLPTPRAPRPAPQKQRASTSTEHGAQGPEWQGADAVLPALEELPAEAPQLKPAVPSLARSAHRRLRRSRPQNTDRGRSWQSRGAARVALQHAVVWAHIRFTPSQPSSLPLPLPHPPPHPRGSSQAGAGCTGISGL